MRMSLDRAEPSGQVSSLRTGGLGSTRSRLISVSARAVPCYPIPAQSHVCGLSGKTRDDDPEIGNFKHVEWLFHLLGYCVLPVLICFNHFNSSPKGIATRSGSLRPTSRP